MSQKKAVIYRMVTPDHLYPWGIKAKDLLKRHGYEVEDYHHSMPALVAAAMSRSGSFPGPRNSA